MQNSDWFHGENPSWSGKTTEWNSDRHRNRTQMFVCSWFTDMMCLHVRTCVWHPPTPPHCTQLKLIIPRWIAETSSLNSCRSVWKKRLPTWIVLTLLESHRTNRRLLRILIYSHSRLVVTEAGSCGCSPTVSHRPLWNRRKVHPTGFRVFFILRHTVYTEGFGNMASSTSGLCVCV